MEYHSFELAPDTPVDFAGSPLDYLSERKGIAPAQAQTMIDRVVDIASWWDSTTTTRPSTRPTRCWRTSCCTWPRPMVARPSSRSGCWPPTSSRVATWAGSTTWPTWPPRSGSTAPRPSAALTDHRYLADVKADVAQAAAYGINGVPFFVFDQKYGVSGAQETATFRQVLEQVRTESEQNVA